ncbi:hypothetical protein [Jezberella montanilacus]|nr:hypothetical protein [Jezberella montanilacus]
MKNINHKHPAKRWVQLLGFVFLSMVLAAGFWAYTTPEMSLHWDSIASMCGF